MDNEKPLVSIVMPCLNEEGAIGICIRKVKKVFAENNISGEIVIADNGSTDKSVEIARNLGVHIVHQPLRGYGNAYLKGFTAARGKYFIMVDADDSYDFNEIPRFLKKLIEEKYDFVTGSRYSRGLKQNHSSFLHRYLGNPLLTAVLNLLFGTRYSDVYSGYRGFSRASYDLIKPVSPGMEFNLELAINARLANLRIAEIPIVLYPRKGKSKLRTFHDGWRSMRMMLLYCPNKVFLLPGTVLFLLGMLIHFIAISGLIKFHGQSLANVTGIFATIFSLSGFEILNAGLHVKTYSWTRRFDNHNELLDRFYKIFKLEIGLILGFILVIIGGSILSYMVIKWLRSDLFSLSHPEWASFGATLFILGFNVIFSSLFISAMSVTMRKSESA